jgi:hypothetical protein
MWNFSAMMSFMLAKVSTMYSAIAAAPIAVRVGASRGRCYGVWWASSPENFFSRNG